MPDTESYAGTDLASRSPWRTSMCWSGDACCMSARTIACCQCTASCATLHKALCETRAAAPRCARACSAGTPRMRSRPGCRPHFLGPCWWLAFCSCANVAFCVSSSKIGFDTACCATPTLVAASRHWRRAPRGRARAICAHGRMRNDEKLPKKKPCAKSRAEKDRYGLFCV